MTAFQIAFGVLVLVLGVGSIIVQFARILGGIDYSDEHEIRRSEARLAKLRRQIWESKCRQRETRNRMRNADCYATCIAGDRVESADAVDSLPWILSTVTHVGVGHLSGERAIHLGSGAVIFESQRDMLRYAR